jgi:hypothetical protein
VEQGVVDFINECKPKEQVWYGIWDFKRRL